MASRAIISVAVFVACIAATLAVVPQSKLYFSIPIPATPAAAPPAATPPANTTTTSNTTTTTTTTTGTTLSFLALGQVLGNLIAAFFGVNWLSTLLGAIFGSGWTPSG